jgi:hypothetical protein
VPSKITDQQLTTGAECSTCGAVTRQLNKMTMQSYVAPDQRKVIYMGASNTRSRVHTVFVGEDICDDCAASLIETVRVKWEVMRQKRIKGNR